MKKLFAFLLSLCILRGCAPSQATYNTADISPRQAYKFLSTAHFTLSYEWDSVQRLTEKDLPLAVFKISAEYIVRDDEEMKSGITADGRFPVTLLSRAATKYFDISEERAADYFRTLPGYDRADDTLPIADGLGSVMISVITDIYTRDGYTCLEYFIRFPGILTADRMLMKLTYKDGGFKIHSNSLVEKDADMSRQISLCSISERLAGYCYDRETDEFVTAGYSNTVDLLRRLCHTDQNIYRLDASDVNDIQDGSVVPVYADEADKALEQLLGTGKSYLRPFYNRTTDSYLLPDNGAYCLPRGCFYIKSDAGAATALVHSWPESEYRLTLELDYEIAEDETGSYYRLKDICPTDGPWLKDNQYIGEGTGYGGPIKVKVTMDGDKISAVDILSHSETYGISDSALNSIPRAVIAAQTPIIDTVAGATITSAGLLDAVSNALSKVGK